MPKRIAVTVLSLALGIAVAFGASACGQSQGAAEPSEDQSTAEPSEDQSAAEPSETQSSTDSSEKFLGTWNSAAIEYDGITLMGDIDDMLPAMQLEVREDGTATLTQSKELNGTWELTDDNTLSVVFTADPNVFVLQDDVLRIELDGGMTALLTHDGKLRDKLAIDLSKAMDLSEDAFQDMIGRSWTFVAMDYNGVTEWGDLDKVMSKAPTDLGLDLDIYDSSLSFTDEDGTIFMNFMGNDVTLVEYRDGQAAITDITGGAYFTGYVKAYGGYLLLQLDGYSNLLYARDDLL